MPMVGTPTVTQAPGTATTVGGLIKLSYQSVPVTVPSAS